LSVRENVLYPYRLHGSLPLDSSVRRRAEALAERLGIAPLLDRGPEEISQGERQRVAIARALVTLPKLLLADEPTGNLDPATKDQTLDLLFTQCKSLGATLLMVTHDHDLLTRFDRVVDVSPWGTSE
jgi:putative ABC transport system ATP-binding protein